MLATQPIGGWILQPIKNEAGEVTGTRMLFANQVNIAGNVPAAVVNSTVPKSVAQACQGTIAYVRKNKQ